VLARSDGEDCRRSLDCSFVHQFLHSSTGTPSSKYSNWGILAAAGAAGTLALALAAADSVAPVGDGDAAVGPAERALDERFLRVQFGHRRTQEIVSLMTIEMSETSGRRHLLLGVFPRPRKFDPR